MAAAMLSIGKQTWHVKIFPFGSVLPPNCPGAIPRELGGLTALTELYLNNNNLSGEALPLAVSCVVRLAVGG